MGHCCYENRSAKPKLHNYTEYFIIGQRLKSLADYKLLLSFDFKIINMPIRQFWTFFLKSQYFISDL